MLNPYTTSRQPDNANAYQVKSIPFLLTTTTIAISSVPYRDNDIKDEGDGSPPKNLGRDPSPSSNRHAFRQCTETRSKSGYGNRAAIPCHHARINPTKVGILLGPFQLLDQPVNQPHEGGDTTPQVAANAHQAESSPHRWGTANSSTFALALSRIIPTWVGNRLGIIINGRRRPDHPHIGGEQAARRPYLVIPAESSPHGWGTERPLCIGFAFPESTPRMWGTLESMIGAVVNMRINPTYVGNII